MMNPRGRARSHHHATLLRFFRHYLTNFLHVGERRMQLLGTNRFKEGGERHLMLLYFCSNSTGRSQLYPKHLETSIMSSTVLSISFSYARPLKLYDCFCERTGRGQSGWGLLARQVFNFLGSEKAQWPGCDFGGLRDNDIPTEPI